MKIYTKGGDTGETGLFGGERVAKDHRRVATYGDLDELNAILGLVIAGPDLVPSNVKSQVEQVQNELFQLGAELATPRGKEVGIELVSMDCVERLESEIDSMEKDLEPLKTFVLPGGSEAAAYLHLARTVCRRAERNLAGLHRAEPVRTEALQFVNRLSDYLFVASRYCNKQASIPDKAWQAKRT